MKGCQQFGGDWTEKKLKCLKKYLCAYTTALKNQPFEKVYIDAFAGTGYRTRTADPTQFNDLFPEFSMADVQGFLKGSASIALEIEPKFDLYYFIEKDPNRFAELEELREKYSHLKNVIYLINSEANQFLQEFCKGWVWNRRAVLFLDPYGMEVFWDTVEIIAKTEKIDMWYLFPLGVAVNRLLKKDAQISDKCEYKLNKIFGTKRWKQSFYNIIQEETLWGLDTRSIKTADFNDIIEFFLERLREIFPGVADNPLILYNTKNNPIYLFCFAASNKDGSKTAIKIAQDILKGMAK